MKIKLFNENAKIPTKSHEEDAGLDMYLCDDLVIEPFETKCVGLGIGFQIPEGYAGIFVPRSSTAKKGLIIQTSIVDRGYTGETHLIITNCSNQTFYFNKGDRVCSMVCFNILNPTLEITNELEVTERGANGLGSSGN